LCYEAILVIAEIRAPHAFGWYDRAGYGLCPSAEEQYPAAIRNCWRIKGGVQFFRLAILFVWN